MKKFVALLTKEKGKKEKLWALYSGYKKLRQFFFNTYLLTNLNKDTPNLLKVINIWTS